MTKIGVSIAFTIMLGGCAAVPDWNLFAPFRSPAQVSHGEYSFNWRLSGDRAVAPLQVFNNASKMWLQFSPDQPIPAIFENTQTGERLVKYQRDGAYIVLDKVWPRLVLRGGRLASFVERFGDSSQAPAVVATANNEATSSLPVNAAEVVAGDAVHTAVNGVAVVDAGAAMASEPPFIPVPAPSQIAFTPQEQQAPQDPGQLHKPYTPSVAASAPLSGRENFDVYEVSPGDQNIRTALAGWAQRAGWTFEPEHWAVDADIPIVGSAQFSSTFQLAVQDLVASTELADQPLQPCFYSNKVLRIVPYAQACDRTAALAEAS